ncbi:MAG: redoxin domain-containing protein [Flavobacteriaceae bacterium]|nr:redoxin domain-containing protein [Flavobacteriaceae bacterium]
MKVVKITLFLFAIFVTQTAFVTVEKFVNPDYLVVKFHADWCGNCIAMGSSFEDLQEKFKNDNIEFVKFDLTDKETSAKAEAKAKQIGISEILDNNRKTGFILIIDNTTKKVLYKLTKNNDTDAMEDKIREFYEG